MLEILSQPWHWSVSGLGICIAGLLMVWAGGRFGMSTSFDTLCSIGGAGKKFSYFRTDWREHAWLLWTIGGMMIGGWIASTVLGSPEPVRVSSQTVSDLAALGVKVPAVKTEGMGFIPEDLFTWANLGTLKGLLLMVVGGFCIGFGTRYAGGCTSGHAISGLGNLQLGSLIAVMGFFAGGLLMTHILLPIILTL